MTKQEKIDQDKMIQAAIQDAVRSTAEYLARTFVTDGAARSIAKQAIPQSIRDLDSQPGSGNVLMLTASGSAGWGTLKTGIYARGDKILYEGIFLREYDEDGVIVAPGSEINPGDYFTQAQYEAAVAAINHTLQPTWDWTRIATGIATA
jgi:hypothetical protein